MNEFNYYLEFINSLDNVLEEIHSIVSFLLQNNSEITIDKQDILLYLTLLNQLLTCLNRDLQRICYLINK